jgi:hypothetical protein
LGPVWVVLLVIAAASAVAVGQQCARRPAPWPTAAAKLVVASTLAAAVMVLLACAGSGRLGNFGDVGVDQTTFGPSVFLWFVSIGGLTVAMAGGLTRRPPRAVVPKPAVASQQPLAETATDDDAVTEVISEETAEGPFGEVLADDTDDAGSSHFAGGPAFESEQAQEPVPASEPVSSDEPSDSDRRPEPEMTPAPDEAYHTVATDHFGEPVAFDPDEDPEAHFVVDDDDHAR